MYWIFTINWVDFGLFLGYLIAISFRFAYPFYSGVSDSSIQQLHYYWVYYIVQTSVEALFVMFLWLRLAYFFRVSQYAGSLLVITAQMAWDILYFISLVLIVVIGSAVLMDVILHTDYEEFSSFEMSLKTLGYAALGHGDFLENVNGGINAKEIVGNFIFFVFLIIVTILLINLLIAILNGSYTDLKEIATGLWAIQFVDLIHRCETLLWPPPLNILAIIYYSLASIFCPNNLSISLVNCQGYSFRLGLMLE